MKQIEKIKGGYHLYVTDDESLLVTESGKNTVYIYDLESRKLKSQIKTVSNVSYTAVSPDKRLIACKNTSGLLAIASVETGEEIVQNALEHKEGYQMHFTPDGKSVLDFDWGGRTMLYDFGINKYEIIDGQREKDKTSKLPRVSFIHYDLYSNQIYKFVSEEFGNSKGVIMMSSTSKDNIHYETVKEFFNALPDPLMGISFCKNNNYYVERMTQELVVSDKSFNEIRRIAWPKEVKNSIKMPGRIYVSPCEKYVFFDMGKQCDPLDFTSFNEAKSLSYIFNLETMSLVKEFDYEYVSDFTMIDDDRKFLIATWKGTYIGDI